MGRLSFLRLNAQRVFDISIVALAVGCGYVGYHLNENEDEAARRKRLHQEQARRQRRRLEEAARRFEHVKSLAKQQHEVVELLLQKRKEILALREELESLTVKLLERHKELELEIEEIRRLVKLKQELRARSQALSGSVLENDNSAQASEGEGEKKIGDPGEITSSK